MAERIHIHPISDRRTTNYEAARRLSGKTPSAFLRGQDLLVAAKKYVAGPRLFRSQRFLIENLQTKIYDLRRALAADGYQPALQRQPTKLLFAYMSEFSDVFPNWQKEYAALNEFIPLCLDGF